MSLYATVAAAATEAQGILSQIQGMPLTGTNANVNFQYAGASYQGVFGDAIVTDVPNVGGGYVRKALLPLYARRDQFTAEPKPKQQLTRTDLSPQQIYLVQAIDTHDPFFYVFQLVKNGA